jgi:hypothetical protein
VGIDTLLEPLLGYICSHLYAPCEALGSRNFIRTSTSQAVSQLELKIFERFDDFEVVLVDTDVSSSYSLAALLNFALP